MPNAPRASSFGRIHINDVAPRVVIEDGLNRVFDIERLDFPHHAVDIGKDVKDATFIKRENHLVSSTICA